MALPRVTVVIPVLNAVNEIDGCLDALRQQSYPSSNIELIIVDNGSTDGSVEVLRRNGIDPVCQPKRGRSRALNAGLALAQGDIICTTDISCRPSQSWIEEVVNCFEDPAVGCVAGEIKLIPTRENLAMRFQSRNRYMSPMHAMARRKLPFLPFADGANASFRKALFDQIGPFDETFFKAADVEICYRMFVLTDYKIVFSRACLVAETGEPDIRALLWQRFRMGMGHHLMVAKYPLFYSQQRDAKTLKVFYWSLRAGLKRSTALFSCLIKRDLPGIEDEWVRLLMSLAQRIGCWYGAGYFKRLTERPSPVDFRALRLFVRDRAVLEGRVIEC